MGLAIVWPRTGQLATRHLNLYVISLTNPSSLILRPVPSYVGSTISPELSNICKTIDSVCRDHPERLYPRTAARESANSKSPACRNAWPVRPVARKTLNLLLLQHMGLALVWPRTGQSATPSPYLNFTHSSFIASRQMIFQRE
jgi:hypothetical protein